MLLMECAERNQEGDSAMPSGAISAELGREDHGCPIRQFDDTSVSELVYPGGYATVRANGNQATSILDCLSNVKQLLKLGKRTVLVTTDHRKTISRLEKLVRV